MCFKSLKWFSLSLVFVLAGCVENNDMSTVPENPSQNSLEPASANSLASRLKTLTNEQSYFTHKNRLRDEGTLCNDAGVSDAINRMDAATRQLLRECDLLYSSGAELDECRYTFESANDSNKYNLYLNAQRACGHNRYNQVIATTLAMGNARDARATAQRNAQRSRNARSVSNAISALGTAATIISNQRSQASSNQSGCMPLETTCAFNDPAKQQQCLAQPRC